MNDTAHCNQDIAIPKRSIPKELRLSEQKYLVDDDPLKKACRYKVCNLKIQVICSTFKVHFYVKCLPIYHTS